MTWPSRRGVRLAAAVITVSVSTLALAGSALPTITPTTSASALATAMDPLVLLGASFVANPPEGTPNAVADSGSALGGFPTVGGTYAILTSGDANLADDPNTSEDSGEDIAGPNVRGDTDFDVTVLKVDLGVPLGKNCLTLDFRFLSDEFPEFVDSQYNDAFIAELDTSSWTTSGSDISAPNNFAFDPAGNVISINAAGAASMSVEEANGTTYDGATPILSASTPVTPGATHSLYLSIFDQGDHDFDSAVFLDGLTLGTTTPDGCKPGATVLATAKTADSPTTPAGGSNGYTITISNSSNAAASLTSIFDVLPFGFTYTPSSTSGVATADPTIDGHTLTWNGPFTVPAGGSVSLHFNVTVAMLQREYFNDAGGTATDGSVSPTGQTAKITVTEPAPTSSDLSITKTDSLDPVLVGQELTYTLSVLNNGPDTAHNVFVYDTLPPNVSLVSVTPSQGSCPSVVACDIGSLAAGASATVTIKVTPTSDADLTNEAIVSGGFSDPHLTDNVDTEFTTVNQASADLSVTKTDSPDPVVVGQELTYTITVANAGPNPAQNVTLSDLLPATVSLVSVTPSQGSCTSVVSCDLGTLTAGATATVTIKVTATSDADLTNTATVSASTADPSLVNNTDTESTAVSPAQPPTGSTCGTVQGNGVPRENGKAKFTFHVVYKTGAPAPIGSVTFDDQAAPMMFASTSISSLVVNGKTARVTGTGTANGQPVRFGLDLDANTRVFAIQLSNGYSAMWTPKQGRVQVSPKC